MSQVEGGHRSRWKRSTAHSPNVSEKQNEQFVVKEKHGQRTLNQCSKFVSNLRKNSHRLAMAGCSASTLPSSRVVIAALSDLVKADVYSANVLQVVMSFSNACERCEDENIEDQKVTEGKTDPYESRAR